MPHVVIPYLATGPDRRKALDWVLRRYAERHPTWTVTVAPTKRPWVKANAVMPAVRSSLDTEIVVADADVWCDGLERAVSSLQNFPWARPHKIVHRLTREATAEVLAGDEPEGKPTEDSPYMGLEGGGFVVARRQTLLDTPLDHRFVGWGQEDASWGIALTRMHGACWPGKKPLYHLWHPPQERSSRRIGSDAGYQLFRRYTLARSREQMQTLIDEVRP